MTQRNGLGFAAMWIAASALALAGCDGRGDGRLSADGMARIAVPQEATMAAPAMADAAPEEAATVHEEDHATESAVAAPVEAQAPDTRAVDAGEAAVAADTPATEAGEATAATDMQAEMVEEAAAATGMQPEVAEEPTEELQAQPDSQAAADAPYDPTDPGGTLEGAAGREAAARLAAAAAAVGAWPGTGFPAADGRLFNRAVIRSLHGSAFYSGQASGRYATRAAVDHEATTGRFTATAIIRATFYAGGLDVTGSRIDHFVDRGGDMDMSDWVVDLRGANVAAAGTVHGATTALTGGHLWYGVWEAKFHGINHGTLPTAIVGRFKAVDGTAQPVLTPEGRIDQFLDSGLGVVIGSFGARRR